ncbi:hypothetical protein N3K66_005409 [Trichothecium roseum]|uniref:Uncharacterized protein n=1 Tax=Trichothecium roseum TaxID=47278 RepID=A0ACC0UXV4_9HYPO|nr:hypothetical protein N3K66_005409 [Trichothecium roseum]
MAIVEHLAERISLKAAAGCLGAAWIVWTVIQRVSEHRRIKALGSYATNIPSWAPLGLDLVAGFIGAVKQHAEYTHWLSTFHVNGLWTTESRLLGRRSLFTADPENVKAILATQFADYGKGEPFHAEWEAFLGDSIFTTDGALWHASRQLIRPQFTRDRVSDLHCFEAHVQTLFRAFDNGGPLEGEGQPVVRGAGTGKVFDVSELFFRLTLDITTEFLLGQDTKSLTSTQNEFADAFNEVQRVQSMLARASKIRGLIPKAGYWAGLATMNRFVNRYIQRALRLSPAELELRNAGKHDAGYTFLHALAGFTRDPKVLRDQMVAVLLAGRDTTASTLSWAMYELGRHPAVVRRLRAEILDAVGPERTPTYEDLKGMTYLRHVLNETLRLYPSVPFNVRLALRDTTLPRGGGPDGSQPVAVLKDTPIGYSTLVMHRRPDLYPPASPSFAHPHLFSPERWESWHPRPHEYIPFNAGPRICVGQQFALTEMSYVLTRIFQRYERVENRMAAIDGGKPLLKSDIVLSPGQGVRIALFEPAV